MRLIINLIAISTFLVFTGCATTSKDISSIYISPLQYNSFDCEQLAAESQRIQIRASQLGGRIDESARNGNLATTAAVILFWPAAFFTGSGNKEQQAELSRLKGEQDAVEQSAIVKRCTRTSAVQTLSSAAAASAAAATTSVNALP
jgi:hypothetical protein